VKHRIAEIREKDRSEREESLRIAQAHPIQWREHATPASSNPHSPDTLADLASSGVTPALGPVKTGSIDESGKPNEKMKQLCFTTGEAKDSTVPPLLIPDISI